MLGNGFCRCRHSQRVLVWGRSALRQESGRAVWVTSPTGVVLDGLALRTAEAAGRIRDVAGRRGRLVRNDRCWGRQCSISWLCPLLPRADCQHMADGMSGCWDERRGGGYGLKVSWGVA